MSSRGTIRTDPDLRRKVGGEVETLAGALSDLDRAAANDPGATGAQFSEDLVLRALFNLMHSVGLRIQLDDRQPLGERLKRGATLTIAVD